jgi:DNA-binding transcriptional LysR family regulator
LQEALRNGRIDLVIGPLPSRSVEFTAQPLVENTVVVVAAATHAIFARRASLRDLLEYRWILPAASYDNDLRSWLDNVFERRGLPRPTAQLEADSLTLLPEMIAQTKLLSFITRWNLGAGRIGAALREVPLKETTMTRRFGTLHRKDAFLSPALRRLIAVLERESKRLTPLERAAR